MFTAEELAEIAAADAEIEASFSLTCQDIRESKQRDKQALFDRKDRKGQIKSARQREYREANRDKISAQKREYYEANRDKISAQKREYYEANREKVNARQREYYEANREKFQVCGAQIRERRIQAGMRQIDVARAIGVDGSLVSHWETGRRPPDLVRLETVFPGILEEVDHIGKCRKS